MSKELIEFSEFLEIEKKLEIRFGQVMSAERIANSKKLLKLLVIFGPDEADEKTVVTNLGDKFQPEEFLAATFPFITNLKPVTIMGVESQAMIMVAENNGTIELTAPSIGSKLL